MSKPSDEWGTPQKLFDIYNSEFNFNLDVCASEINFKCADYHTRESSGLVQDWKESNWCNPPYSNQLPWVRRAVSEVGSENTSVLLMKYDPSTKHGVFAAEEADEIRIVTHRIKFEGAPTGANFPSAFAVFRPRFYTRKTGARILYVNYRGVI
jgi:phage N-6-adenine-methyltransferase